MKIQFIHLSTADAVHRLLRRIAAGAHIHHVIIRRHAVEAVNALQIRYRFFIGAIELDGRVRNYLAAAVAHRAFNAAVANAHIIYGRIDAIGLHKTGIIGFKFIHQQIKIGNVGT